MPPGGPRVGTGTSFRLAVLEYGRLRADGEDGALSGARLEAQLKLLQARGFVPVTASEVAQAYRQGTPLPPRSVLLTFDGGYLSTYEAAHPVLARLHWPALMLLDSGRQEHRDPVFLYWDRLQLMLDSGVWELGTHGHRALRADGTALPPPTSGEEAFRRSRALLESSLRGCRVSAFAHLNGLTPPLGSETAPSDGPQLAFHTDLFGLNGPEDQPLRLNRLQVDPGWTPEVLLQRLEAAMIGPASASLDAWVPDQKLGQQRMRRTAEGFFLEGDRRNDLWLAGSRWVGDWVLQARVRIDAGEFWIAQEAWYGGPHWRFGGKQDTLYFQERTPGLPPRTLARLPQGRSILGWHDLRITRRGPGVWVELDGHAVSELPFNLPTHGRGNLGIVSAPAGGPGRLALAGARFTPISYRVQPVSADPGSAEVRNLQGQVSEIAALSPKWIQRQPRGQVELTFNQDLLRMMQRRFAWDILPEVRLLDGDFPPQSVWLAALLDRAAKAGWDGLRLDVGALSAEGQRAWREIAQRIEKERKTDGLRLWVESTAPMEGKTR